MVAMHSHLKSGIASTILRTPRQRKEEKEALDTAREILDFVGIGKWASEYARNLSYGDQRRLEVARALALKPEILLLDEPTAGMNPQESGVFVDFVHRIIKNRGIFEFFSYNIQITFFKISTTPKHKSYSFFLFAVANNWVAFQKPNRMSVPDFIFGFCQFFLNIICKAGANFFVFRFLIIIVSNDFFVQNSKLFTMIKSILDFHI